MKAQHQTFAKIVTVTKPGAIGQWTGPGGEAFDRVSEVWDATGETEPMDFWAWIQGSGETVGTEVGSPEFYAAIDAYIADHESVRNSLLNIGIIHSKTRTAICGLSMPGDPEYNVRRIAFNEECLIPLSKTIANCVYIPTDDIPTQAIDDVHWTGPGCVTFGKRIGVALSHVPHQKSWLPEGASAGWDFVLDDHGPDDFRATRGGDALVLPPGKHDLTITFDDGSTQLLGRRSGVYPLPTLIKPTPGDEWLYLDFVNDIDKSGPWPDVTKIVAFPS